MIDELRELLAVRVEVGDGTAWPRRIHCRLGHRGRDHHDETRIERLGDQVFRAEAQVLDVVGMRDDVRLLGHRQIGNRAHARELHLLVDGRGADIERAPEDERKAQDVVDLVGKVGAAGRDHRIGPRLLGHVRHDLRFGIRKRQDEWRRRHLRQPLGLEHTRRGKAEEYIRAGQDFGERARRAPPARRRSCGRPSARCARGRPRP